MSKFLLPLLLLASNVLLAQNKKPLTHDVYDGWKSVGERTISNDGNYILYAVNPQEGDGEMVLQNVKTGYKKTFARGYNGIITEDSKYAIFKIKPAFHDTRQAKIKKKKPDDMPKDSLVILLLGTDSVVKISRVKSYKTPEKGSGWLVYHLDKPLPDTAAKKKASPDSLKLKVDKLAKLADSLIRKSLDSVKGKIEKEELIKAANKAVKEIYKRADELETEIADAEGDDAPGAGAGTEGTELFVRNLGNASSKSFRLVNEYLLDEKGRRLLIETTKNNKDSNSKAQVLLYNLASGKTDTVLRSFNDAKNFVFDEEGNQLVFVAERDSSSKSLQKFYKLWYFKPGMDSANLLADKHTVGMRVGFTVSENANPRFSKDGKKIFFGTAPVQPAKDTSLVDFELARLDIWNYKDDYLQPQQLKQLPQEQRRSYLAVTRPGTKEIVQLGNEDMENVSLVDEGNADWVLAQTTKGNRLSTQWEGRSKATAYIINTTTAAKTKINNNSYGFYSASPNGKYVYWYDPAAKNYFAYNVVTEEIKNISSKIKEPLYDTENDVPDFPSPAGNMGWVGSDQYFLIKDEFDIWQVDPNGNEQPKNITNGYGRKNKTEFNYVWLDRDKRFMEPGETILLSSLNKQNKYGGYFNKKIDVVSDPVKIVEGAFANGTVLKAKDANQFIVSRATPAAAELYAGADLNTLSALTNVAAQQKDYNWFTSELVRWKMFDGKMSEGILFKPENFDPKKKYPVVFYFYERNADGLYGYRTPAPSASTINIAYFVSNGYIVFDPNIYYKTGEPGQSAYNSVVSAAKYLATMPWVDSTKMGIQGQSWGGYQVAYLVTKTNMFRAAGAGAPVANMTSAYGGIRWGSGMNRQFQYEKTQSRIGATLWQKPELYIKNSPLFTADKIQTPLLIMHNDADGAVPWYQGIELFTALKRLDKKVWLLQYNGEDHNLIERKNRKDLSIRLSQFFDHYLKGAKPARWMTEGLPAVDKGRDWGYDLQ
ncbi:MAG: S9 family peptidase [Sphingobacteriales bacterium]|nr:MAG: S9 family peptidase [Sphingobacteriales bacterium]